MIKVLIDTNILISAALSSTGMPYAAYMKAVSYPYCGMICDQNVDELRRVFNRKFPDKLYLLDRFLAISLTALQLVKTPCDEVESEKKIRDVKDRPILRAAITAGADIILTGDRDFLEADIKRPKVITATEFMRI